MAIATTTSSNTNTTSTTTTNAGDIRHWGGHRGGRRKARVISNKSGSNGSSVSGGSRSSRDNGRSVIIGRSSGTASGVELMIELVGCELVVRGVWCRVNFHHPDCPGSALVFFFLGAG